MWYYMGISWVLNNTKGISRVLYIYIGYYLGTVKCHIYGLWYCMGINWVLNNTLGYCTGTVHISYGYYLGTR
jgi:hypothetical protein